MSEIWLSNDNSIKKVEFFSEEKLAYFCLKAIESLCYLHSNQIYYGDMKPENLLIFRDYKVKLGDFGVSLKLPNNSNFDDKFYLKGLTFDYSMDHLIEKF